MDEAAEKAAATYLKLSSCVGDRPARHATRAVLLQMEFLSHATQKKREQATREVAQALVDQSTQETSQCAALLLEQAAVAFHSTRTAMTRKYAFYLILAGYIAMAFPHQLPTLNSLAALYPPPPAPLCPVVV